MHNALYLNEKCNTPEKISRKSLDVILDNTNFGSSKIKKSIMKKIIMLFMLLAVMTSAGAQNASNAEKFFDRLLVDFEVGGGTKCNGVTLLSPSVNLGYKVIPRMSMFLHTETLYGHYDELKSYARTQTFGGGVGYTLWNADAVALEVRGTVAAGLSSEWKNVTYDAGLMLKVGRGKIHMNVGVGFRHISSRTAGIDNYNGASFILGFGV
jgi:hypothetical protein